MRQPKYIHRLKVSLSLQNDTCLKIVCHAWGGRWGQMRGWRATDSWAQLWWHVTQCNTLSRQCHATGGTSPGRGKHAQDLVTTRRIIGANCSLTGQTNLRIPLAKAAGWILIFASLEISNYTICNVSSLRHSLLSQWLASLDQIAVYITCWVLHIIKTLL